MNKQREVYLMLFPGKCWHEWLWRGRGKSTLEFGFTCSECGLEIDGLKQANPDLTTWTGFGLLWEAAQMAEWWGDFFAFQLCSVYNEQGGTEGIPLEYINPTHFLDALHEFGVGTGRIKEKP